MNEHNYLYLIWKNPTTRRNYIVGKLSRNGNFKFEYCEQYQDALKNANWELLTAFPEESVYESEELFASFACRLPDPKRRDIKAILEKYGLDKYDGYELLRKTRGRLPIDTYEFIDPIFPDDETIERDFYVMGIRHSCDCRGKSCDELPDIKDGDELELKVEPTNPYDRYAVQVFTKRSELIGYIPRYYSESVATRMAKGMTYLVTVTEVNKEVNCVDCIRVRLKMPKE